MKWVNGDGSTTVLLSGQTPERSANESNGTTHKPYYTKLEKTLVNANATTGTFGVRLHVYGLATNKQIGFCDLLLEGKLYSTATGIRAMIQDVNDQHAAWYTLLGVRTNRPAKGIYIHNGRKIVIK